MGRAKMIEWQARCQGCGAVFTSEGELHCDACIRRGGWALLGLALGSMLGLTFILWWLKP